MEELGHDQPRYVRERLARRHIDFQRVEHDARRGHELERRAHGPSLADAFHGDEIAALLARLLQVAPLYAPGEHNARGFGGGEHVMLVKVSASPVVYVGAHERARVRVRLALVEVEPRVDEPYRERRLPCPRVRPLERPHRIEARDVGGDGLVDGPRLVAVPARSDEAEGLPVALEQLELGRLASHPLRADPLERHPPPIIRTDAGRRPRSKRHDVNGSWLPAIRYAGMPAASSRSRPSKKCRKSP